MLYPEAFTMSGALLKYDAACRAIAEAKTVDEVTDWIDKAAAVREYGRRIKDRRMELDAIEIRVIAKRRRGELLAGMKASGQLAQGRKTSLADDVLTLEALQITRNESSEEQKIAAIPLDSFERLKARCRAYAEEHPEKHSFDVLGEGSDVDKKTARETREKILGGIQLALPDKKYGVILADPEWRFKTYSRETGMDRAADNHYPTSETDLICARPVADIAADDCALFLWATVPMLPDALRVMAAWGFDYKSHCIWLKDRVGTGYWFRNQHELLLLGTRGKIPAPAMGTQFVSVNQAAVGSHSEKPASFYMMIENYFPTLPKIELNARRARDGWDAWGLEAPPHDPETGEIIESQANADVEAAGHVTLGPAVESVSRPADGRLSAATSENGRDSRRDGTLSESAEVAA
jgi:N6-adenosine-specific RNA methylase IME4